MKKLSKEVRAGIIITIAIGFFIYGFNFLKGKNLFAKHRTFFAVYTDIDGLVEANPVQVNGFKIGQVSRIQFYPDNSGRILVSMMIKDEDINIPENTVAKVISSDLLGSKAVQLLLGNSSKYAANMDTLKSETQEGFKESVNKQIEPLKRKAEGLIASIDSVMVVVKAILDKSARNNLAQSFESIKIALGTFEKTALKIDNLVDSERNKLSSILSKIESITNNFAANNDKLTNVMNNFSSISDSLARANIKSTIDNANIALKQASDIMAKINKGQGTMGMLINNDSLYRKLDASANDLDKLMIDLKANPHRYLHFSVFGKKEKAKKAP